MLAHERIGLNLKSPPSRVTGYDFQRLRKNIEFLTFVSFPQHFSSYPPLARAFLSTCRVLVNTLRPWNYIAGINRTMRTKLWAAAAKRKAQSTRLRPRNLVWRRPATVLIHANTFSTQRRFFWLRANSGCSRSRGSNQFCQALYGLLYSATRGTARKARNPWMKRWS